MTGDFDRGILICHRIRVMVKVLIRIRLRGRVLGKRFVQGEARIRVRGVGNGPDERQ